MRKLPPWAAFYLEISRLLLCGNISIQHSKTGNAAPNVKYDEVYTALMQPFFCGSWVWQDISNYGDQIAELLNLLRPKRFSLLMKHLHALRQQQEPVRTGVRSARKRTL
jgi:hypothetical protein